ncbi:MAG: putative sugar O-methyltransferase [Nevskia sp.]|nr:putative sugar O-methyltransferase [Nevskia sp.]
MGIAEIPRRLLRNYLRKRGYHVEHLSDDEWQYLEQLVDDRVPVPAGIEQRLRQDHPRLREIEQRYERLDIPARVHSRWSSSIIRDWVTPSHFRGDTPWVWHYRERRSTTALKYFVYLNDVEKHDRLGLLKTLQEDGQFGCWTWEFPGHPRISRDLLDSITEINFLDRQLQLFGRKGLRVLDIGAGYGRLAHRVCSSGIDVASYVCCDAVPMSSFLCEYYLEHRKLSPPARVCLLDEVEQLQPGSFDIAFNVHSFSECTHAAIGWWVGQLKRLKVPYLFLVPNDGDRLLSNESNQDHTRRDFSDVLDAAGYRRLHAEPVVGDPAARELVAIHDQMLLYRLDGA